MLNVVECTRRNREDYVVYANRQLPRGKGIAAAGSRVHRVFSNLGVVPKRHSLGAFEGRRSRLR
jgi:hypothetical protein